jgi:hypothetical protein
MASSDLKNVRRTVRPGPVRSVMTELFKLVSF